MSLPSPDEPLTLGDGRAVVPTVAKTFQRVEVPSGSQAQRLVTSTRRKLADLPALPKEINTLSAVLVYTASGLSDNEIAVATRIKVEQIRNIRDLPAYRQLETNVFNAVAEQTREDVQGILAGGERKAAERVVSLIDSEDDKVALKAADSLLDRRGHKPKTEIDIRHQMMSTLRIEVVDKRESIPIIDGEAIDATDAGS